MSSRAETLKVVLVLPAGLLRAALGLGHRLGLTPHTPDKLNFLRYRPVLSNRRLKEEFGYRPEKTSEQVFRLFVDAARARGQL